MINQMEFDNGIFVIQKNDNTLIYSPRKKKVFGINKNIFDKLKAIEINKNEDELQDVLAKINQIKNANKFDLQKYELGIRNSVVFLISDSCNFDCRYCYATNAHGTNKMSIGTIKKVVDTLCQMRPTGKINISFLGGGEPFMAWNVMKESIEYIRALGDEKRFSIGVTTNGTLLTSEIIDFLYKNMVNVSISFDILPHIQNVQRPMKNDIDSYNIVNKKLSMLIERNVIPNIRTTIMPIAADKMPDMVEAIHMSYPQIKQIHFEHVTMKNLGYDNYYKIFRNFFWLAREKGNKYGIFVKNSITTCMGRLTSRFCYGEMSITPAGDILACHRVSSINDKLYSNFKYGHASEDGIELNDDALLSTDEFMNCIKDKCNRCFMKYHCAGACSNNAHSYSEEQMEDLCLFIQEMGYEFLFHWLNQALPQNT